MFGEQNERRKSRIKSWAQGQVLVIFAIALPVLLLLCALGIDMAFLYVERRHLQSTSDLAALAGAIDLPDAAEAEAQAYAFAARNGLPHGTNGVVVSPIGNYEGDDYAIKVRITKPVDTFFLNLVGMDQVDVSARAVAAGATSGDPFAIFVGDDCSSDDPDENVEWSGSDGQITGGIHSNAGFKMGGSKNTLDGQLVYSENCTNEVELKQGDSTYTVPPTSGPEQPWPIDYTWDDIYPDHCTHIASSFDIKANQFVNGAVYCATNGDIELQDNNVSGRATFVSRRGDIEISGNNYNLEPQWNGVLAASFKSDDDFVMDFSGDTIRWQGMIYAPNGYVQFQGQNANGLGSVVALKVQISGSDFTLVGDGLGSDSTVVRLLQ